MQLKKTIVLSCALVAGFSTIASAAPPNPPPGQDGKGSQVVCNGQTAAHPVWETQLVPLYEAEIGKVKYCSNGDYKATVYDVPEDGDYHLCLASLVGSAVTVETIEGALAGDDLVFSYYTPANGDVPPAYLTALSGPGLIINLNWVERDDDDGDLCELSNPIAVHGTIFTDLIP